MKKLKKLTKKDLKSLIPIISIIAVIVVSGIIAFLTDTDEKNNKIKIGNVDIILHEYSWNPTEYSTDDESGDPDAVVMGFGETMPKDPQVENVGRTPAYIYVRVDVPRGSYQDGLTTVKNKSLIEYEIDTANWTELESARSVDESGEYNVYYYYYNSVLDAPRNGETSITPPLFSSITLKEEAGNIEEELLDVNVKVFAIQSTGLPAGTTVTTTEYARDFIANAKDQDIAETYKIAVGDGSLDSYNIELREGEKIKIELQKPQNAQGEFEEYTFSSEDSNIATATNDGLITGVDGGTTIVTITGSESQTTKTLNITVIGKIPVGDCEVSVKSETMKEEETQKITITKPSDREGDIEASTCSSSNTDVVTVDNKGNITAVGPGTATITILGSKSGTSKTVTITVKGSRGISISELETSSLGDYVDLGTNLLDKSIELQDGSKPKSDWRVFLKEDDGAWLITSNYMPVSKRPSNLYLNIARSYIFYGDNRADLLNKLNNTAVWKVLIKANDSLYNNSDVIVKGAPSLSMWVDSWNSKEYKKLLCESRGAGTDGCEEYTLRFGNSSNYEYSLDLSSVTGNKDTLYFPYRKNVLDNIDGYWLGDGSTRGKAYPCLVDCKAGALGNNHTNSNWKQYGDKQEAIRPVVYIPYGLE